ncbi:DUF1289 domain-containing protein [Sandaracinobacteroides sp. A072]
MAIQLPPTVPSSVPSPCRNVCRVKRGICTGCGRTLAEIEAWPTAPDSERLAIVRRAAGRIRG